MKIKSLRYILVFLFSFAAVFPILSQDDFVQFTRYDQLNWSPDGNQLAFRCLLLDEANPEKISANILLKNLSTDQLICLNPQPERFVISKDKKFLLFSSVYGLYFLTIEPEVKAGQILFRNPAASWFFKDFGFYENKNIIYVESIDYSSGQITKENYQIDPANISRSIIGNIKLKKITEKIIAVPFNQQIDEFVHKKNYSIKIKNFSIQFIKNSTNYYELVLQSQNSTDSELLVKNCRPRLLSINPDSSKLIISLFRDNDNLTYLFETQTKKLTLIYNQRYFSVSWLDNSRYICISEKGLFLRKVNLPDGFSLNNWILPEWCLNINLDFPKIANLYDFYNSESNSEIKSYNGKIARVIYKKQNYLRCKIGLSEKAKKENIVVNEMNNIPNFRSLK